MGERPRSRRPSDESEAGRAGAGGAAGDLRTATAAARAAWSASAAPPADGLARLQRGVAQRRRRRRGALAAAAALLLVAGLGGTWAALGGAPESGPGAVRAPGDGAPGPVAGVRPESADANADDGDGDGAEDPAGERLALVGEHGGLRLLAGEDSDWRLLDEATVGLERGVVCLAVRRPRTAPRLVAVWTPDATATVTGTRFCVQAGDGRPTRVRVAEGTVEVRYAAAGADAPPVAVTVGQQVAGPGERPAPLPGAATAALAELAWERPVTAAELGAALGPAALAGPAAAGLPAAANGAGAALAGAGARDAAGPAATAAAEGPTPDAAPDRGTPADTASARGSTGEGRGPADCDARYAAAEGLLRQGRDAAAARGLEGIARVCPAARHAGTALMDLGRVALGPLDDAPRALAAYDEYLARFPRGRFRPNAWAGRCLAAWQAGRPDVARRCATTYLETWPDGPHAETLRNRLAP
jgi:hypothetical protein